MTGGRKKGLGAFGAFAALAATTILATGTAGAGFAGVDLISQSTINGNGAFPAFFAGTSNDGGRVFFRTTEQLATTDTDGSEDVYLREGTTTTHISQGQINGNGVFTAIFLGASNDGGRAFFGTSEPLAATDVDTAVDIYMREGGTTTFVTDGGLADTNVIFNAVSNDGGRVIFSTLESLDPVDGDAQTDVYARQGGTTTVLSDLPGVFAATAGFAGASADAARVFFVTDDALTGTDGDAEPDVYVNDGGTITQISQGNLAFSANFVGASKDGARALFTTREPVLPGSDTDAQDDLYMREGGTTTHLTPGQGVSGNGAFDVSFDGVSDDGARVLFHTFEQLAPTDTDTAADLYMREGGTTTHISQGQIGGNALAGAAFEGISSDGGRVFFRTQEQLAPTDTDARIDLYTREGGITTHDSQGQIGGNGDFNVGAVLGISSDGSRIFFTTEEQLAASDTDAAFDSYVREGGVTTHVTQGQTGGNSDLFPAFVAGISQDGGRAFFTSEEQLAAGDLDNAVDVYAATIESVPPETTINSGPANPTTATDAAFTYSSSESGSSFECSLDGGAFAGCPGAGTSFSGLGLGSHTFAVRATDVAGNTDATPAAQTWEIQAPPTCRGKVATIVGTKGSNRIRGTKRRDVIAALGGNDNVKAGKGNDLVCAGKGNDTASGDDGNDKLFGERGRDRLLGKAGRDLTNGGPGRDTCNGGPAKDRGPGCERGPEA